jgi:hypothetical protein
MDVASLRQSRSVAEGKGWPQLLNTRIERLASLAGGEFRRRLLVMSSPLGLFTP